MSTKPERSKAPIEDHSFHVPAWSRWPSWSRTALLASGVGLVAGLLAALLFKGMHWAGRWLFEIPLRIPEGLSGNFHLTLMGGLLLVAIPALGGLFVGWLAQRTTPQILGGGTELLLKSYHEQEARLPGRLVPLKWLASCVTVGSGGSGGTEGPISLIGASAGSWLAQRLGLSQAERRLLFTAGLAGGIGSVFRAPLGGALFACELYYTSTEVEQEGLVPSLLASVSAYLLFGLIVGFEPLLSGDSRMVLSLSSMGWFTVIALAAVLACHMFVRIMRGSTEFFAGFALPWRPALGGAASGLLALALFVMVHWGLDSSPLILSVMSEGYPMLQQVVVVGLGPALILTVALGKMFSTSFTLGSGGSAGIFAPIIVIGGCVGALAVSVAAPLGLEGLAVKPAVLAGMAALFAAGTACPLAALFITTEVAQGYQLLPGLMWAVALAYLLRPRPGLIKGQLASSAESPAHRGRFHGAALRRAKVSAALQPPEKLVAFAADTALAVIRSKVAASRQELYPVLGPEGQYLGAFRWNSVEGAPPTSRAGDLAAQFPPLRETLDLERALEALTAQRVDELPVVDAQGRWRGLLNRRDLINAVSK